MRLICCNFRDIEVQKLENEVNNKGDNSKCDIDLTSCFKCTSTGDNSGQFQTKEAAVNLCVQILDKRYSGDPMTLDAFIDSNNLLEDLVAHTNVDILRRFNLCKLVGGARKATMGQTSSIADIKISLRNNMKPLNTKAIEARLLTLQFSFNKYLNLSYTNVCTFAEELFIQKNMEFLELL